MTAAAASGDADPAHDTVRVVPGPGFSLAPAATGVATPPPGDGPAITPGTRIRTGRLAPVIPDVAIECELGRGGMSVVYKGRQAYIDRTVAIKVLPLRLDEPGAEDYVQRFQREARILATLTHPHIVGCHQAGVTSDGSPYLVLEFIDGPNLWQWIRAHGALSEAQALRLVGDIARALAHAHARGVIHRDVKPENILLAGATPGADGLPFVAKLADLGLARPTRRGAEPGGMRVTVPGVVMGTPATMAPEQFDDPESVDLRADIYGLGCVLYHALTGKPAFPSRSLIEIVTSKLQPPPDPRALIHDLSPRSAALVQAMLAPQRDDRPRDHQAVIDACDGVGSALAGRPVRRRRVAVGVALALVALALGIALIAVRGAHRRTIAASGAGTVPLGATSAPAASGATPAPASAAPEPTFFADSQPLVGERAGDRLAGWTMDAGWSAVEGDGLAIAGIAAARRPIQASRALSGPTFRVSGVLAAGARGHAPRFREAGFVIGLADGGSQTVRVQNFGGVRLNAAIPGQTARDGIFLFVSGEDAHGNDVAQQPVFLDLPAAAEWDFSLVAQDQSLAISVAGARPAPLPLLADPVSIALFVADGAVTARDLRVAYPR